MEPYLIRKGTLSDFKSMFRLLQEIVTAENLVGQFMISEEALRQDFIRGSFGFVIAETIPSVKDDTINNKVVVVGCLLHSKTYEYLVGHTFFFHGGYVTANYRGTILENMLIQEAKRMAIEAGIPTMLTFTSTGGASPMKALGEEGGKRVTANIPHDVFLMTFNPQMAAEPDNISETYTIRDGNDGDTTAIYDLLFELAVWENIDDEFTVTKQDFCSAARDDSGFQTIVLEYRSPGHPAKIVGCVVLSKFYNFMRGVTYFLQGLYITPGHRGRGNGRKMVRAIIEMCHGQGMDEFMFMIQRENSKSQALFTRFGATNMSVAENPLEFMAFNDVY